MFTILYSQGNKMLQSNPIQDFLRIQRRAHDHVVPSVCEHSHRVKLSIKSKPNKIFSIHKFLSTYPVCMYCSRW